MCLQVVVRVFWRIRCGTRPSGPGSVIVTSVEVLWALPFAVGPNGEAKFGEQDMNVRYGFTEQNGVLLTVKVLAD